MARTFTIFAGLFAMHAVACGAAVEPEDELMRFEQELTAPEAAVHRPLISASGQLLTGDRVVGERGPPAADVSEQGQEPEGEEEPPCEIEVDYCAPGCTCTVDEKNCMIDVDCPDDDDSIGGDGTGSAETLGL